MDENENENDYEEVVDDEEDVTDDSMNDTMTMSTNTSVCNKSRYKSKIAHRRLHKGKRMRIGSDSSNRSYLSQSHIAAVGYKRKIRNLLQNNKSLAKALEEANLTIAEQNKALAELDWQVRCKSFLSIKLNNASELLSQAMTNLSQAMQYSGEPEEPTASINELPNNLEANPIVENNENLYIMDFPKVARLHEKPSKASDMSMIAEVSICEEAKLPPILFEDDNTCDVVQRKTSSRSRRATSRNSFVETRISSRESRISSKSQSNGMPQTPIDKDLSNTLLETPKTPELIHSKWKSNIPKLTTRIPTLADKSTEDNQLSASKQHKTTKLQPTGTNDSSTCPRPISSTEKLPSEQESQSPKRDAVNLRRQTFVVVPSPQFCTKEDDEKSHPVSLKRLTYSINPSETQQEQLTEEPNKKIKKRSGTEGVKIGKPRKSRITNRRKTSLAKLVGDNASETATVEEPISLPNELEVKAVSDECNFQETVKETTTISKNNDITKFDAPNMTDYICKDMSLTEILPMVVLTDLLQGNDAEKAGFVPSILPAVENASESHSPPTKPNNDDGEKNSSPSKVGPSFQDIADCSDDSDFDSNYTPVKKKVFDKIKIAKKAKEKKMLTIESLMKVSKKCTFVSLGTRTKASETDTVDNQDGVQSQLKVFDLPSFDSAEDSFNGKIDGKFISKKSKSQIPLESKKVPSNEKKSHNPVNNDKINMPSSTNSRKEVVNKERSPNNNNKNVAPPTNTNKPVKRKTQQKDTRDDNESHVELQVQGTPSPPLVANRLSRARKVVNYCEESMNSEEFIGKKKKKRDPPVLRDLLQEVNTLDKEPEKQVRQVTVSSNNKDQHECDVNKNVVSTNVDKNGASSNVDKNVVSCDFDQELEKQANVSDDDFQVSVASPKTSVKKSVKTGRKSSLTKVVVSKKIFKRNSNTLSQGNGRNRKTSKKISIVNDENLPAAVIDLLDDNDDATDGKSNTSSDQDQNNHPTRLLQRTAGRSRKPVSYKERSVTSKLRRS